MTSDHHEERVKDLITRWATLHLGLVKLLEELPVPIAIPAISEDLVSDTLNATAHAAEIVLDQPISDRARDLIAQALTFWLAAHDLVVSFDATDQPWRARAASLALQQAAALCVLALDELDDTQPE
ncbi:hypothetical protein JOL79_11390 [Microbispora sp. RL4-1S]|uniref:Uncharacterized protein n=1 Tax=Microbispora oryzae TaxID=2806554 RepID=A0A940WI61_9ACTN|nr:hypothetical protein [Microbispora oryzae]MBP2704417.1 hypothetical protein [Microbispora oryzae]